MPFDPPLFLFLGYDHNSIWHILLFWAARILLLLLRRWL
jgi:hypothetical protein